MAKVHLNKQSLLKYC